MLLPTLPDEMRERKWRSLDIIFVSGDTYMDVPTDGMVLVARYLERKGYRVGIIAQPDPDSGDDIMRLGEPELFWAVTGGSIDSMISNYTSLGKPRREDDLTPGGINRLRPDRSVIRYCNSIKRFSKTGKPIVIGGIEASLRRFSHYDYHSNSIRRSILADSRADYLVYGMGEKTTLELARDLATGGDGTWIRGICYLSSEIPEGYRLLPSWKETVDSEDDFIRMHWELYAGQDPLTATGMVQQQDTRFCVHNPPAPWPDTSELDDYYASDFKRIVHPFYEKMGKVRALDTVRFSVTTHRGCYGECSFCSIAMHQGRRVVSRSEDSIVDEVDRISNHPEFRGNIDDLGGPTANMYGMECGKMISSGACRDSRCMGDSTCRSLDVDHGRLIELMRRVRSRPGIKNVFVRSGIRHDLVLNDKKRGSEYLRELILHHVSGQLRLAPEHVNDSVLSAMNKPSRNKLEDFIELFERIKDETGKKVFLTYYFIAAHPGTTLKDMKELKGYCRSALGILPRSVQVFTPSPSTHSTMMYLTGRDLKGNFIYVEKSERGRKAQKDLFKKNEMDTNHKS
jgi:uncharacterized radical SAM protein YgiQ